MKQKILLTMVLAASVFAGSAQKYFTKNGSISFFSKATLENIKADNNQVLSVLDAQTGLIQFSALNNAFHFPKALMEEHFNADYMESAKYPKSTFAGKIDDLSKVNFTKDGTYAVTVSGDLNIHGVKKAVTAPATITIKGGKPSATSTFNVLVADYNISIPKMFQDNISKTIQIKVSCNYEPKS